MALQGPAIPAEFGFVFPAGAFGESVEPVYDFDASKGRTEKVQPRDKTTGLPLWVVHVYDPDPQARPSRPRSRSLHRPRRWCPSRTATCRSGRSSSTG